MSPDPTEIVLPVQNRYSPVTTAHVQVLSALLPKLLVAIEPSPDHALLVRQPAHLQPGKTRSEQLDRQSQLRSLHQPGEQIHPVPGADYLAQHHLYQRVQVPYDSEPLPLQMRMIATPVLRLAEHKLRLAYDHHYTQSGKPVQQACMSFSCFLDCIEPQEPGQSPREDVGVAKY